MKTSAPDFNALAQRIHEAVKAQTDFAGQLMRVNRPQTGN
jgi:hypothetical protein